MGRYDLSSSGEEFATLDKTEVKANTAYVTRRLVKNLQQPEENLVPVGKKTNNVFRPEETKTKSKPVNRTKRKQIHVLSSDSEDDYKVRPRKKEKLKKPKSIVISESDEPNTNSKSVLENVLEKSDNEELDCEENDSPPSPVVALNRARTRKLNLESSSDEDKDIEFNLVKDIESICSRKSVNKGERNTPARKSKVIDDTGSYSPLTTIDESCSITPQRSTGRNNKSETINKSKEESKNSLLNESHDVINSRHDGTPMRKNVRNIIPKSARGKQPTKKSEKESSEQSSELAPELSEGDKLNKLDVQPLYKMPNENRSPHIRQCWRAPRQLPRANKPDIKSPASYKPGGRGIGMGLSKFSKTKPIVRMNETKSIDSTVPIHNVVPHSNITAVESD